MSFMDTKPKKVGFISAAAIVFLSCHVVMRKPALYICKNKYSYCTADQCLCFCLKDCTIALLLKSKKNPNRQPFSLYRRVCVNQVRNPKDRFSPDTAQIVTLSSPIQTYFLSEMKNNLDFSETNPVKVSLPG